ncbi:MAG: anaerobic glycerol-3-phosphate dehydrogenase subunit GlpA [Actinomycetia bacterium]|nr:anaerobic glycerol-3-phosphate dehydrogenase subunit GlpA [Actinomycetes bacterium]
MRRLEVDVVVVGGGSTGAGVLRDLAMRGYSAALVERADLAQGTSGRFHGLLHSGGRYVVSDPQSATECASENQVLSRIQASAIELTGGLFVCCPDDDPAYGDRFLAGAQAAGVPATEVSVAAALRREPRLNPGITRAIEVTDGSVDGWQLVWTAVRSAQEYGAQVLTYHRVTSIERSGDQVSAVFCEDALTGEQVQIGCRFVLNCAGAWAGQVAAMAGCYGVGVVPGRGIMVAMNHRLVNSVVNRLIYPGDGDILVPVHTVCIIGTTDVKVPDPDRLTIPRDEVQQMLDAGEVLVPGFRQARALHAWSGARPLVKDTRVSSRDTRHMSRGMSVLDHSERDGLRGLLTVCGGKLTTYRLMAEHTVNAMEDQLGSHHSCRTAEEPCPGGGDGAPTYVVSHRLHDREQDRTDDQIICECELMSRRMYTDLLAEQPTSSLDDLRRQLRLGMGPCQGGFCSVRAAGIAHETGTVDAARATGMLRRFLDNRIIGLWPILYGDQLRQTALDSWIFSGTLDTEHLPEGSEVQ